MEFNLITPLKVLRRALVRPILEYDIVILEVWELRRIVGTRWKGYNVHFHLCCYGILYIDTDLIIIMSYYYI